MVHQPVALITGASSGIGRALALRLARGGFEVWGIARRLHGLEAVAREAAAAGGVFVPLAADVRDQEAVAAAFARLRERAGRLDVLVTAAGVCYLHPADQVDDAQWREMIDTNLTGTMRCVRQGLRLMLAANRGDIVMFASYVAIPGAPGVSAYAATKAGVLGYARSVAAEVRGSGIRVTAVCPREVDTPMRRALFPDPAPHWMRPEDVAEAVAFALGRPYHAGFEELVIGIPPGAGGAGR